MSVRLRLAAVAIALLIPAALLAAWTATAISRGGAVRPLVISARVGPWTQVAQRPLTADEVRLLAPDEYLGRTYQAPGRPPIWLYTALYAEQPRAGKGAHDPRICYPAQGWEVVATHDVEIELPGGESFVGNLLSVHRGREEQRVLYWFQPADRWPGSEAREQLTRVLDALAGRSQYAFVRLAAPVMPGYASESDLREFASRIAWPIRLGLIPRNQASLAKKGRAEGLAGPP